MSSRVALLVYDGRLTDTGLALVEMLTERGMSKEDARLTVLREHAALRAKATALKEAAECR